MGRAALVAAGWVSPLLRELREVAYQFDKPLVVDASKFCDAFAFAATPHRAAIRATLEYVKSEEYE
jgi:hypothetical protein